MASPYSPGLCASPTTTPFRRLTSVVRCPVESKMMNIPLFQWPKVPFHLSHAFGQQAALTRRLLRWWQSTQPNPLRMNTELRREILIVNYTHFALLKLSSVVSSDIGIRATGDAKRSVFTDATGARSRVSPLPGVPPPLFCDVLCERCRFDAL